MCLAGTVVAFWSLMQEMAGSSLFLSMNSVKTFRENSIVPHCKLLDLYGVYYYMIKYSSGSRIISTFQRNRKEDIFI